MQFISKHVAPFCCALFPQGYIFAFQHTPPLSCPPWGPMETLQWKPK